MRHFTSSHCRAAAALMTMLLCAAPSSASANITDDELIHFVRGYLDAAQQPTPHAEVGHYAARVRYFNNGTVDQGFVAEDQRRYYHRWPERSFELLDGPVIIEHDGDAATVRFTIRYEVSGAGRRATGMTENTMRVQRFGAELRIVAMSERKVNSRDLPRPLKKSPLETQAPPAKPKSSTPLTKSKPPLGPASPQPADLPAATERQTPKLDAPVTGTGVSRDDSAGSPPQANAAPEKAIPVPDMPGYVYPPATEHTPRNMIDVRGYAPGQKVKDPRTGQVFLVP